MHAALPNKKHAAANIAPLFSTVIKVLGLDGWVLYCDRSVSITTVRVILLVVLSSSW